MAPVYTLASLSTVADQPKADACRRAPSDRALSRPGAWMRRLTTRMYFPGDALLATDPILKLVEPARRATLVAKIIGGGALEWNVVLQGTSETVFFDLGL